MIKDKIDNILFSAKYWVKYSLFLLVLLALIVLFLRTYDPAIEGLEKYLELNDEISKHVGVVEDYQIINVRYVSESDTTSRYNEYSIRVVGAEGRARFKLRAKYMEEHGVWEYYVLRKYND